MRIQDSGGRGLAAKAALCALALVVASASAVFANGSSEKSSSAGKSGTISFANWADAEQATRPGIQEMITKFQEAHPNITVKSEAILFSDIGHTLVLRVKSGNPPDVAEISGNNTFSVAATGGLQDLSSYVTGSFKASINPADLAIGTINGKLLAFPWTDSPNGLWYNKDILDKVGIQPPKTIAELTADLAKVKAAGYKGITLTGQANDQGEWQAYPWLSAYGWSYSNPSAASIQQGFSLVNSWVQDGYLSKIVTTWGQAEPFQAFTVGDVAFAENGNWQLGSAKSDAHFNYGVVAMPSGSSSAKVYLGGEVESVGAFSKNPALAWDYLKGSYFSKAGQLIAFKDVGSIPSRKDAAEDPEVTGDALLAPFAQEVQAVGAPRCRMGETGVREHVDHMGALPGSDVDDGIVHGHDPVVQHALERQALGQIGEPKQDHLRAGLAKRPHHALEPIHHPVQVETGTQCVVAARREAHQVRAHLQRRGNLFGQHPVEPTAADRQVRVLQAGRTPGQ